MTQETRFTPEERLYLARVSTMPCCACLSAESGNIHYCAPGSVYTAIPLCDTCDNHNHLGNGVNGSRWKITSISEAEAMASTFEKFLIGCECV